MDVMDTNYAAPGRSPVPESVGRSQAWRSLALIGFVVAILVQMYALYLYVPGPATSDPIPHADKVIHAALFAIPAFLGVLARLPMSLVIVLLALHAPVSELVQHHLIPVRGGDPWDLVADWVGILVGVLAARWVLGRRLFNPAEIRSGRSASR